MKRRFILMTLITLTIAANAQPNGYEFGIANQTQQPIEVALTIDYQFGPGTCVSQKEQLIAQIPTGIVNFTFKTPADFNCPGYPESRLMAIITITQINGAPAVPCTYQKIVGPYENSVILVLRKQKDGNWQCHPATNWP